ncbi:MAG: AAA family ATPase [Gemmiger sp.]|uniref:nucleotide-binding protein n=1 Tax=Gemmiger sp. TaxID=2049027 RepID=UPI002E79A4F0|nr:AAA family ATPase [Gemmiger sp.]MEE0799668.1 AAA family ATPase [Gemmiger sp.]
MNAQTIMICSGKGGTGKSTVSVLVGAKLAARGKRVLLIELDSGLRSVDVISGVYGKTVYDIEDVLCGRCPGEKAIVQSPLYPGLSVISAPYEGGEVRAAPLAGLILAMRDYFDFILLDTAAGMGAPFCAADQLADRALVVLTPDPIALRDGRIVADTLLQHDHAPSSVRLVVNRVSRSSFGRDSAVYDLDECIDTVGLQLIAVIPESRELQQAGAAGTELPPGCLAALAGEALAGRLLGERIPLVAL